MLGSDIVRKLDMDMETWTVNTEFLWWLCLSEKTGENMNLGTRFIQMVSLSQKLNLY